jgi:hypothetical protein
MMRAKKRKPGLASTAAFGLVGDPGIRSAALEAAPPMAKLGLNLGRRFARRRTQRRIEQINEVVNTIAVLATTYGPILAQQLGVVEEPPKAKRTAPLVVVGALAGAGAVYFLEPGAGAKHRRQIQKLVAH